jgi:hypothetical protein
MVHLTQLTIYSIHCIIASGLLHRQCEVRIDIEIEEKKYKITTLGDRNRENKHTATESWQFLAPHPGEETSTKPTTAKCD